jgi:hypothetical protein
MANAGSPTVTAQALTFLLVPDAGAARRLRRLVAARGGRTGVLVGWWPELVEWARHAYLAPAPDSDAFGARLGTALGTLTDAFWAESWSIAPAETSAAVCAALTEILSASDPSGDIATLEVGGLAERPRRHLGDLLRLVRSLDGALPDELAVIRDVLASEVSQALRTLRVVYIEGFPVLSRWQVALVEKLNRDAGADAADRAAAESLYGVLREVLPRDESGTARGALGVLQSRLFRPDRGKAPLDTSVQWVGVRDFLQEAEVAAGVTQSLLAAEPDLKPADIGLLLPDSFEYAVAVEDAFRLGGLALSGLPVERWRRDLGREAVFHFLYCRQKPAPAMAIAVCLSSPLMPWSTESGAEFAQTVMDGDYELKPPKGASSDARAMLALLREGDSDPESLTAALRSFAALLDAPEALAGHVAQARVAVEELCAALANAREIDWGPLRAAVTPKFVTSGETPNFNLEGVTVWRDSQEPWRAVRRLIVLGFAQGQYPSSLGNSPVFSAADLAAIRVCTGLPVGTPADELARRRERFRRQLGATAESVTFLVPRRNPAGEAQAPSESLVFMHRLFDGPKSADGLIAEVDVVEERARVQQLSLAAAASPRPPRPLVVADLRFERDLLALRTDDNGAPKPESPSGLETLMVSAFAWLLRRVEAEPLGWAPESATPALLGTLAHKVLEGVFYRGAALPAQEAVPAQVESWLDDVLRQRAPFLRSSQWKVERRHLAAQTILAAQAWRDMLERLGAEVLASEEWLRGTWGGIPIHGQTDLLLGLPDDRLLVVDYKRSKSGNRLTQMQKGFDSQATLYRAMLGSGGPTHADRAELIARIAAARQVGVVYYMLNDQVALSDTALPGSAAVPGWRTLGNDIAAEAMTRIQQRIGEVRAGELRLNREGDGEYFEKQAGIKPYALEVSPLIGLFSLPADPEEAS